MKHLLIVSLSIAAAWPAAGASVSCDAPSVDALLGEVTAMKATAPTLDSFEGRSLDVSRDRCSKAAQALVIAGKDGGQRLICVSHPTVSGGIDVRKPFGEPGLFKSFTTDLRAVKPEPAQALCDRINACLFELSEQPKNPAVAKLSGAWDGFECEGE